MIAEAQRKDQELKVYYEKNAKTPKKNVHFHLIEDMKVLYKNGKVITPALLRHRAVSWYHHYLQHPGHSHLKETMISVMYWKGMCNTIRKYVKSCRFCQVNKRHSQKYGHVPPKLVITTPWKALCVDLIGPYTLKGKDGSSIDFMCLTMINATTSWFKIVEQPSDIDIFLSDAAWAICSTYQTVLKASPGTAIFGQDILFNIPLIADWRKIGEHRQ